MLKRMTAAVLIFILGMTALISCGEREEDMDSKISQKEAQVKIGITFDTFILERWTRDRDVFVSTAHKLGATVNVQNANGDVKKQIGQIEKFIEEDMDAIVIVAVDCYSLTDVVEKAKNKGIEVISYDRMIQGVKTDLYITVDNEQVGREMAKGIKECLPDGGNIVMICGPDADTNSREVVQGFENEIEGSGLVVVSGTSVKAWVPEYGFQAVNEAFQDVSKIDAVMCGNDGLAGYAIKALSEQQLAGKVIVTGQDADLEACQRIVEGTQYMTIYKPIEELARKAARLSVKLAEGEQLFEVKDQKKNDVGSVPYYGLQPVAVTAANMDETIIDSGFHLYDEVYLNVK